MWPEFMPDYGPYDPPSRFATDLRPAMGMANGKYFLEASSWPYNPQNKDETYHLFHHHGDTFLRMFSEVPEQLTVTHDPVLAIGMDTFTVQADAGAVIGLTVNGEIIGVADATGAPQAIPIVPQTAPGEMLVTVTQANHYRYSEPVLVIYPVTYTIEPFAVPINEATPVTVTVWDDGGAPLPDVEITIDGWGIDPEVDVTDANGQAHLTVTPPYGESLTLVGRQIGESYNCIDTILGVSGGTRWQSVDIDASVPAIGLYGALAPHYEGTISGTASESGFTMMAVGCGVDVSGNSGGTTTLDLHATPDCTGTMQAVIAKSGYELYLEEITVQSVYGTLSGTVTETGGTTPIGGARIAGYPAGADTTGTPPLFATTTAGDGTYTIEGDLEVEYYDVYAAKFGYLTGQQEVFIQVGANTGDFELEFAPSGLVSGTVVAAGSGLPLEASIKVFRGDTGDLYAEVTSDPGAGGAYSVALPYFNYTMLVRAYHHIPQSLEVTIDEPNEQFDFVLEETLANILILDDDDGDAELVKRDPVTGAVLASGGSSSTDARSSAEIATDLVDLGFDITEETSATSDPQTWINYDFIISASGNDTAPIASAAYRAAIESWVAGGGKLLIEGGEVGYDAASSPGYPTFAANVLHIVDWEHDSSGNITIHDNEHPITTFPNVLGTIACNYSGWGDEDSNVPSPDAEMICAWSSYPSLASVQIYDDDPDPTSCQIIYYAFNYAAADPVGRKNLLENSITYLIGDATTAIDGPSAAGAVPARHVLGQATPNPFNPVTRLTYGLPTEGTIELAIYNVAGQRVRTLADGVQTAGFHTVAWDGRDEGGRALASGMYFCRMHADGFERTTKLVLLK
jgi:hypothetical protein